VKNLYFHLERDDLLKLNLFELEVDNPLIRATIAGSSE